MSSVARNGRHLRELFLNVKDARGGRFSFQTLADYSGGRISKSMAHKMITYGVRRWPTEDQIEGLALGLGLDAIAVVDALQRDLGDTSRGTVTDLTDPDDPDLRVLIGSWGELSPEFRRLLMRQAQAYRDVQHERVTDRQRNGRGR